MEGGEFDAREQRAAGKLHTAIYLKELRGLNTRQHIVATDDEALGSIKADAGALGRGCVDGAEESQAGQVQHRDRGIHLGVNELGPGKGVELNGFEARVVGDCNPVWCCLKARCVQVRQVPVVFDGDRLSVPEVARRQVEVKRLHGSV